MRFGRVVAATGLVWLAACSATFAQVVPPSSDAGRIPQRFEQAPQPKASPRIGGIELPSTVAPGNAARITLTVRRFEISGSTIYSADDLSELTNLLIGKTITLADVYALAARITGRYGRDGYVLSRAIIPPQSLSPKGAVVRIEIIEGYIDEVTWPEQLRARYRDFFSTYEARIVAARPADIKVIERYLLLAGDLPGLSFTSTFKPSTAHRNASTLIVTAREKPVDLEASIDNRGSEGRGPWQAQVAATANNWLGQHEALSIRYATAVPSMDQLEFVEGTWRQVLNSEGLTLILTGSYNTGIPGLPPLQAIQYESTGVVVTAMLSYPVIRSRDQNLTLAGGVFLEDVESNSLGQPFTEDRLRGLRARVDYDRADTFGGINFLQVVVSQGIEGLGSTDNGNILASRATGRVDFTKIEGTASRSQQLDLLLLGLSLYGAVYGQYALDPLLVAEQCSYGGKTFGRALDPSSLTGDNCVNAIVELRYDLNVAANPFSRTQLYGFADHGLVDRKTTSAGVPNEETGSSAGGGLRLGWRDNASMGIEAARTIGGDIDQGWRGHFELTLRY